MVRSMLENNAKWPIYIRKNRTITDLYYLKYTHINNMTF